MAAVSALGDAHELRFWKLAEAAESALAGEGVAPAVQLPVEPDGSRVLRAAGHVNDRNVCKDAHHRSGLCQARKGGHSETRLGLRVQIGCEISGNGLRPRKEVGVGSTDHEATFAHGSFFACRRHAGGR